MSPRDEIRARAKELGIKNVSKYTAHQLAAQIELAEAARAIEMNTVEHQHRMQPAAPKADLDPDDLDHVNQVLTVQRAIADFEGPKRIAPNRAEMRRLGSRFGFYRQPRTSAPRTGSAGHWLSRAVSERPSKSEYLKAKREAKA